MSLLCYCFCHCAFVTFSHLWSKPAKYAKISLRRNNGVSEVDKCARFPGSKTFKVAVVVVVVVVIVVVVAVSVSVAV